MEREEWETPLARCVECGAEIDVGRDRGYQAAGSLVLCWSCAIGRGGRFDEAEERWTSAPETSGLSAPDPDRVR